MMAIKFDTKGVADVTYSCYNAMNKAGGSLSLAQEILTLLGHEHVDSMARNGIRFTYDKKKVYSQRDDQINKGELK